jgi:hypothetical protein
MLEIARDHKCMYCQYYIFKPGNPTGWRWTYCTKKGKWFADSVKEPGDWQKCSDWRQRGE